MNFRPSLHLSTAIYSSIIYWLTSPALLELSIRIFFFHVSLPFSYFFLLLFYQLTLPIPILTLAQEYPRMSVFMLFFSHIFEVSSLWLSSRCSVHVGVLNALYCHKATRENSRMSHVLFNECIKRLKAGPP